MIVSLLLPLLLQAGLAEPTPPMPGWNCNDPKLQPEIDWCQDRAFDAADAQLMAQWDETAAVIKARDAGFAARGGPEHELRQNQFENLLEAQRGWLLYRDAHCRVHGSVARRDSLRPGLASLCRTVLTENRTTELRELVEAAS